MTDPDSGTALEEIAFRWVARLDAGTLSADEEAELEAWTRVDSRHAGAFARAMAANAYLDRAAALGVPIQCVPTPDIPAEAAPPSAISRRAWLGGAGGALAASLLAAAGLRFGAGGERIQTPLGTIRRASLQDGSAVTLNSDASIEVALHEHVRSIRLLAGEANFDVAKDLVRPFVVEAGGVRIRVVGTSFQVRLLPADAVAVTVQEGIVEVSRESEPVLRLTAGDRTVLHASGAAEQQHLSEAEVDRIGLWQSGQIDLTGMTLADAAAEFARYSDRHIEIDDPAVARMKVAGIYSISDPAGFARDAAESLNLRASASAGGVRLAAVP